MINEKKISKAINNIVKAYDPLEIYLFGSYAWGHPDNESDLDLLIVVEQSDVINYKRPFKAYDALMKLRIPNDVIVFTKEEFEEKSSHVSTLTYKIKTQGKKVYAKA